MACAKTLWLKQHQFIQYLLIAVGDTVVTMNGTERRWVWQVHRRRMDAEVQEGHQLCGQQKRPASVPRATGSLPRVFSRGW